MLITAPPTCSGGVKREKSREENQRHQQAKGLTAYNRKQCAEKAKDSPKRQDRRGRRGDNAGFRSSACRTVPQYARGSYQAQSCQRKVGVTVPPSFGGAETGKAKERPDQKGKVEQEPAKT